MRSGCCGAYCGGVTEDVSVPLDRDTVQLALEDAERRGETLAAWMAQAAKDRLRRGAAQAVGELLHSAEGAEAVTVMHANADRLAARVAGDDAT